MLKMRNCRIVIESKLYFMNIVVLFLLLSVLPGTVLASMRVPASMHKSMQELEKVTKEIIEESRREKGKNNFQKKREIVHLKERSRNKNLSLPQER
jgi:hypothetical protein